MQHPGHPSAAMFAGPIHGSGNMGYAFQPDQMARPYAPPPYDFAYGGRPGASTTHVIPRPPVHPGPPTQHQQHQQHHPAMGAPHMGQHRQLLPNMGPPPNPPNTHAVQPAQINVYQHHPNLRVVPAHQLSPPPVETTGDVDMSQFVPPTSVFVARAPKPYQCASPGCDKKYKLLTGIINHHYEQHRQPMKGDDPEKLFKCQIGACQMGYKQAGGLAYHIERAHAGLKRVPNPHPKSTLPEDKPYVCTEPECGKRYKSSNGLAYHRDKQHPTKSAPSAPAGKPLACPADCGRYFSDVASAIYHCNVEHSAAIFGTDLPLSLPV
ncbi:hypothetical protein DFJ74DRAFT_687175 [Hyaloraphidium curvatum]|nr:hypothetical protein DFJ74DRAFT_687175 [Hyaloraphidium curvatum]